MAPNLSMPKKGIKMLFIMVLMKKLILKYNYSLTKRMYTFFLSKCISATKSSAASAEDDNIE